MEFNFKEWVMLFGKKSIWQNCIEAAPVLGVSVRTVVRLYYGYKPRHYNIYVRIANSHVFQKD